MTERKLPLLPDSALGGAGANSNGASAGGNGGSADGNGVADAYGVRGESYSAARDAGGASHSGSDNGAEPPAAANVSRRDVMKYLGMAPVAGALAYTAADVERASSRVREFFLSSAQQQYAPKFFTADEWRTLNLLVDYIIPRDAKSGSATDAKVPEFIDFMLTDTEQNISVNNQNAWRTGLKWLNDESTRRFTRTFAAATDAQRRLILNDIAWPARAPADMAAGVTFFNRARDMTAAGFFSSQMGWQDIGYIGNAPVPTWNGCPQPALAKLGVSYALMNTRIRPRNG